MVDPPTGGDLHAHPPEKRIPGMDEKLPERALNTQAVGGGDGGCGGMCAAHTSVSTLESKRTGVA